MILEFQTIYMLQTNCEISQYTNGLPVYKPVSWLVGQLASFDEVLYKQPEWLTSRLNGYKQVEELTRQLNKQLY